MSLSSHLEDAPSSKVSAAWFRDRWIVSRRYDLFFFIGSSILTIIFWIFYRVVQHFDAALNGESILVTYFVFSAFFDQPHIFQTFSRTHFDPVEFKTRRTIHTLGLGGLILLGFGVIGLGREADLIVFVAIFGSYHIFRQHYGFLKAYKNLNRDRDRLDDWLDFSTFSTGILACLFYDYTEVGNPIVIYQDLQTSFPDLPPAIADITWTSFLLCLSLFIARQFQKLITRQPLNLPKILLMVAVLSTHYFVFYLTATPFLVAEALETVFHDVQYHGWMMHYQQQRFPQIRHIAAKWMGVAMLYGISVGIIEILGLRSQGLWMWIFIPFTMITLYHYVVDGLIWRFSKQPELAPILFHSESRPS